MPHDDYPLPLFRHPATLAPMVHTTAARAVLQPNGALTLSFRLRGDMARLRIPTEHAPERTDLLWEHTCFEAFIGVSGDSAYREFNFSPSGQWAAFAFSDYRRRDETHDPAGAPQITATLYAGRLDLEATISPALLPRHGTRLRLGLAAVVEAADTVDGSHSYWALRHPASRPDFHHPDSFTLELTIPRNSV